LYGLTVFERSQVQLPIQKLVTLNEVSLVLLLTTRNITR
jgi:hypothetical protein